MKRTLESVEGAKLDSSSDVARTQILIPPVAPKPVRVNLAKP